MLQCFRVIQVCELSVCELSVCAIWSINFSIQHCALKMSGSTKVSRTSIQVWSSLRPLLPYAAHTPSQCASSGLIFSAMCFVALPRLHASRKAHWWHGAFVVSAPRSVSLLNARFSYLFTCAHTHACMHAQSKKGSAIKSLIRREFEKGRGEEDPEKIEALKAKYVCDFVVLMGSTH